MVTLRNFKSAGGGGVLGRGKRLSFSWGLPEIISQTAAEEIFYCQSGLLTNLFGRLALPRRLREISGGH